MKMCLTDFDAQMGYQGIVYVLNDGMCELINRPLISDNRPMLFGGSDAPLAFVELKSLGLGTDQTADISASLCNLLQRELGIDAGRIYIEFCAPERAMFGWNGGTF